MQVQLLPDRSIIWACSVMAARWVKGIASYDPAPVWARHVNWPEEAGSIPALSTNLWRLT